MRRKATKELSNMNGKTIAMYLPSLAAGGAERVMVTLANSMVGRGYRVDLVLAKAKGVWLPTVAEAVRIVDLGVPCVSFGLPRLVRYLRRERPVALLSALNHANIVAISAHRIARVPTRLVVSEHTMLSQSRPVKLRGHLVPLFACLTYRLADSVIAVSQGVADDLAATIGLNGEKIKTICNPVETPAITARAAEPLSHPWFAPFEPPVVLSVGRLTPAKDYPTLLRAFALLRETRQARLMILGEGKERSSLEALVTELGLGADVALPGFVENPFAYMRRAAVFVLSSRWEGFPKVLGEAMACGAPIVATDCPSGPREILEDGQWGRLVPVADREALALAIGAALKDHMHPNVVQRAQAFSVEEALDKYLKVLGVTA